MGFDDFFKPKRMAVVGVSTTNPFHPANIIFTKNFYDSQVETFAVNIKGGTLDGEKVYASVKDIPWEIDLAVLATRAETAAELLLECAEAGIDSAVVIGGGFSETGPRGRKLQERVVEVCRSHGITMVGPNCLGIYSPPDVDTFFLPPERVIRPPEGSVALISQSGGSLVDQMMTRFNERNIGIRAAISVGNKAMVDEVTLLRHFGDDEDTSVIVAFLEGFEPGRGRELLDAADEIGDRKPIIVMKSARTQEGRKAAASHTAALAGDEELVSSALRQYRIIEAHHEVELSSFAKGFQFGLKPLRNGQVAILTSSGGHGVMAVDLCNEIGLEVVPFDHKERKDLRDRLSPSIHDIVSLDDPVDLTGSASDRDFEMALESILQKDDVEAILVLLLPYTPMITSIAGSRLGQIAKQYEKAVIAYVPDLAKYGMLLDGFELNGIPVMHSIEEAVLIAKGLWERGRTNL